MMQDIFLAFLRSFVTLTRPRVWAMVLAPAALSLLLCIGLAIWGHGRLVATLIEFPPMTWLISWGVAWLAKALAYIGGWMLILALAYFTTALLAAILIMPGLIKRVAERDYPDVAAMGADSFSAAAGNSVVATLVFAFAWLISIPLWLIPGLSLILPVLLMAWYNRRTFSYDALSLHATADEWTRLRQENRRGLFLVGLIMAVLTHVPLLGLLVPTLTALIFIHYCLESLRRLRGGATVSAEGHVIIEGEFSEERE